MRTPLRVHICPVGFEVQRVADPLGRMRADKAYLVSYRADDPAHQCVSRIKEILLKENSGIQVIEEYVNIWNLVECITKFKEIIRKERGNAVFINVSTGTKVTAIAGTIVSMLEGSTPYYAKVDHAQQRQIIPTREKVEEPFEVPVYGLHPPRPEALRVLEFVEKSGGSVRKKDLIKKLREIEIIRPVTKTDLSPAAAHSQLRALLDPLEREWHFVKVESRGRSSKVSLTEQGTIGLRIFS
jgi:hypothetical protein